MHQDLYSIFKKHQRFLFCEYIQTKSPSYSSEKYSIRIRASNLSSLMTAQNQLISVLNEKKIPFCFSFLPQKVKKWTLLRSPHVYKKSREQLELRTFSCLFTIHLRSFVNKKELLEDFQKSIFGCSLGIVHQVQKKCPRAHNSVG